MVITGNKKWKIRKATQNNRIVADKLIETRCRNSHYVKKGITNYTQCGH